MPIGELQTNDVVIAVCGNRKIVGSIVMFVQSQIDSRIRARLQRYGHVGDYIGTSIVSDWKIDSSAGIVEIDASTIVAAPMRARRSKHIIIVVEPAML